MNTILLTRSKEENANLIIKLKPYNFNFVHCTLIDYKLNNHSVKLHRNHLYHHHITDNMLSDRYDTFIITSKYAASIVAEYYNGLLSKHNMAEKFLGVRFYKKRSIVNLCEHFLGSNDEKIACQMKFQKKSNVDNDVIFWVVGNQSASILKQAGLKIAYIASDVEDLIKHFPKELYSSTIYFSGDKITKDLPHEIKRCIVYQVSYCETLTSEQINAISNGVNYILLYSKNCARALVKLFKHYNLLKILENATIITISSNIASELKQYCNNTISCDNGKHEQIIELLINHAKKISKEP
jgi:Uroporphyrinogen-III synthase HemD